MRLPITTTASEQLKIAISSDKPIVFTKIKLVGLTTFETTNVQKPADGMDVGVSVIIDKDDIDGAVSFEKLEVYAKVGEGVEFLFAGADINLDFSGAESRRVILTVYLDIAESEQVSFEYSGGDSAYQVAVEQGFEGTAQEWLESLRLKVAHHEVNERGDVALTFTDGTEIIIETNEFERVDAERGRVDAENLREDAEASREEFIAEVRTQETNRQTNEDLWVASESGRQDAENKRDTAESARIELFELVQRKLANGEFDGKDLEFAWRGTELGVRLEGESEYEYVNLKGETGSLDNLHATNIEEALGFMPISIQDIPDTNWNSIEGKPTEFKPEFHTHEIDDVNGLREELDSVPELTKENVGLGNVDNVKQASKVDFDNLLASFTEFKGNISKFKATENGTLEYHDGEEWVEVRGGTEFKVGNTSGFKAEAKAGLKIEIKFGDPEDSVIIDKNGDEIKLAELGGTQLRGKDGSYPVDENDGILLVDSKVRNQYKDTPFIHDGLTAGDEWFYMAFPYTKNKVFTVDSANRVSAVATNKLNQPAPPAPTISNLKFDRVTVTGENLVSLDKTKWFTSPHTFTGLTEETNYTAYAKKKETAEFLESPVSTVRTFKTPSDLPGPSELVGGTMDAGYFGHVPAGQLFTGTELAAALGITQGSAQFDDVGWLKFASGGKVIFKSQKPFRHSISWDHINSKGAVDGSKIIEKDGVKYRARLMRGALTNPSENNNSDRGAKGSEWNKLMLPISIKAKDQSWAYKDYVDMPTEDWGTGFTDADLHTHYSHGNGTYQWCQETAKSDASNRVTRGYIGVSNSDRTTSSNTYSTRGWSPILEVIS